jgi:hypothetical protein
MGWRTAPATVRGHWAGVRESDLGAYAVAEEVHEFSADFCLSSGYFETVFVQYFG